MKFSRFCMSFVAVVALSLPAFSGQTKEAAPSEKSADEMMKKMEEAAMVTDHHKALEYMVGEWKTTTRVWEHPKAKPTETTGTAQFEPMFGGRFIQETVDGTFMGKPFHGKAFMGYDNMKKKYITVWMDNMSTGAYVFEGESSDKGKTIKSSSQFMCPVTGTEKSVQSVMKKVSKNEIRYEHFDKDPTGKEFKSMEVVYKR